MRGPSALVLGTLLLAACGEVRTDTPDDAETATPDVPLPSFDTGLDPCETHAWETVGAGFVLTWCTPCHSSGLRGAARQGAPAGVDLDDEASALALADRILARATGEAPTMPPAGGPEQAVLDDVVTWLSCATGEGP